MNKAFEALDKIFRDKIELSPELKSIFFAQFDYIYHYTNLDAFKNIVQTSNYTNGLWLSNARFLNDAQEIENGKKIALDFIDTIVNSSNLSLSKEEIQQTKDKIDAYNNDYYVCSFSKAKDSLEQWRSYSQNGNGICIELCIKNNDNYFNLLQKDGKGLILKKVIYEDRIKNEFVNSFKTLLKRNDNSIKKSFLEFGIGVATVSALAFPFLFSTVGGAAIEAINELSSNLETRELEINNTLKTIGLKEINEDNFIDNFVKVINIYYPFFKNESFKSEEEIRLVYYDDHSNSTLKPIIKYRVPNSNMIVPYFNSQDLIPENKQVKLPISKVIIGPVANRKWIKESVRFFLDNNGYENVDIEDSEVPYRG